MLFYANNKVKCSFYISDQGKCITVTQRGSIQIALADSYIQQYSESGDFVKTVKINSDAIPRKITICKLTGKIALMCCTLSPQVTVLDFKFNGLFCSSTGPSKGVFGSINIDAKFDEYDHILVSNSINKTIYILCSKTGDVLLTITSEISCFKGKLRCIASNGYGSLLACIDDQIVSIRYMK